MNYKKKYLKYKLKYLKFKKLSGGAEDYYFKDLFEDFSDNKQNKKCEPNEEYEDVREDIELQIDSIRNVIRQYPIDNQTVDHECAHTQIVDHIKLLEIYNKQIEYQELEELKLVLSERYDTKTIKKLIGKLQYTKVPDIEVPNTEVSDTEVSHTQVSHTEVPYIGDGDTQCKTICNIM